MAYKMVELNETPTVKDFYEFVHKRHEIWHKKEFLREDPPWTDDPILQVYHFCNVYRHLDRGTKWAFDNVVSKCGKNYKKLLFQELAYRCCNLPRTFENLGMPSATEGGIELFVRRMERLQKEGAIFSTAYRASSFGSTPRLVIYKKILLGALEDLDDFGEFLSNNYPLEDVIKRITKLWGVGTFIANEVMLDMRLGPWGRSHVGDKFVNVGPGAAHGLIMMFGKMSSRQMVDKLHEIADMQAEYLPEEFKGSKLTATDVQFSMCEFRKYLSLANGGGKSRKYAGFV